MSTDIATSSPSPLAESPFKRYKTLEVNEDPIAHKNLAVVKRLNKGKYPIFLTTSKVNHQQYVMKIFPEINDKSDEQYSNELRFASLNHPNVISIVNFESNKRVLQNGQPIKASYILSEYASHGDLFDFIRHYKDEIDEKLVRTYFRQLINGVEYLHLIGVAHLDLKPENLLLDADFNLKIADFDLSYVASDDRVLSRGTRYYRSPEFYKATASILQLELPSASDIYSAGIILFVLKSGGVYAHMENRVIQGVNLTELLEKKQRKFWRKQCEMQGKSKDFFDKAFRDLFEKMVKPDPKQRITIKEIKQSKWYNGPVYTPLELYPRMKTILRC